MEMVVKIEMCPGKREGYGEIERKRKVLYVCVCDCVCVCSIEKLIQDMCHVRLETHTQNLDGGKWIESSSWQTQT